MKQDRLIIQLFITALVAASLAFSPFLLDFTLIVRFIAVALFGLAVIFILGRTNAAYTIRNDIVLTAYCAWVAFTGLSVFWAQNMAEAVFEASKQLLALLIFATTFFALKKAEPYFISRLLKAAAVIFLISLLAAGSQAMGITHWGREALYAITGVNGHKNLYASFVFLSLFFQVSGFQKFTGRWKIISGLCIVLSIAVLLLLKTKAVWLGAGTGTLVYLLLRLYAARAKRPGSSIYAALAVLLILANVFFLFVLQPVIHKSIPAGTPAKSQVLTQETERLVLWDKSYHLIKQQPLLGVGAGNWQVNFPDATLSGLYRAEDLNYTFQRPHNDFLWILSETGIIGLNLFLLFLISLLLLLARTIKATDKPLSRELMLCFAFITGYYVVSFFDFPKERMEHLAWSSILLGMAYYHIKKQGLGALPGSINIGRPVHLTAFLLMLFVFITGIMRYKGEYHIKKLYAYKSAGDAAKTLKAGQSALSFFYTLDPTSVPVQWYNANASAAMGNYTAAQQQFISACRANPYSRTVLNDLGSACVFNKDIASAKKYYREASRISPRFDDPKLNLAALYMGEKDYAAAQACLNSLLHDSERRSAYQKLILQQPAH